MNFISFMNHAKLQETKLAVYKDHVFLPQMSNTNNCGPLKPIIQDNVQKNCTSSWGFLIHITLLDLSSVTKIYLFDYNISSLYLNFLHTIQ